MKQKPSFSGIQAKQKAPSVTGKPSLAELMNQYEENQYSTISLKLNSQAPKIQVQRETTNQPKLLSFNNTEEDWSSKRGMSPIRLQQNKENINDQGGHRKKSIHEVNRFADCVRELEKQQFYPQDEEMLAFQPRHMGTKSPLRGRATTNLSNQTSSLLRHAEGDMVFRAKQMETTNLTDLAKKFTDNSQGQKTPRSRSKIGPKIQKQFQESDESEHDSEVASLKESIRDQKLKLFKNHQNLKPEQKQQLERKVHQIKEDHLRVLAEKKSGNKMLPKVIEDMKADVARQIEEFARNYLIESQDQQQVKPKTIIGGQITQKAGPILAPSNDDPRRQKMFQEAKSELKDLIKKKKGSSLEEDELMHAAQPAQQPRWPNNDESEFVMQKIQEEARRQEARRLEEERQHQKALQQQQRRAKEQAHQRALEEQRALQRLQEQQRILAIQRQEARRIEEQRLQAEKIRLRIAQQQRFLQQQLEQQRRNQQLRLEAERQRLERLQEQQRYLQLKLEEQRRQQEQRIRAENQRQTIIEMERLRREEEQKAQQQRLRLRAVEEQRLLHIRLEEQRRLEEERQERQRIRLAQQEMDRLRSLQQQRKIEQELRQQEQRFRRQRQLEQSLERERQEREERERIDRQEQRIRDERAREEMQRLQTQMKEQRERQERREFERLQRLREQERLREEERLLQERIRQEEQLRQQQRLRQEQWRQQQRRKQEQRLLEEKRQEQRRREEERLRQQRLRQERRREQEERLKEERRRQEERLKEEQRQKQLRLMQQLRVQQEQRLKQEAQRLAEIEKREQLRLRMLEEQRLLKAQMEQEARKAQEERVKNQTIVAKNEVTPQLRTSLKVESLFTNYSIFSRQVEPEPTPEVKIEKLFEKVKSQKPIADVQFKFDFGLDLDLGDTDRHASVLSSRDKFGKRK